MKRAVAIVVLAIGLFVGLVVAPTAAIGQDAAQDDPAPSATTTATADSESNGDDDESVSNLGVLLFGAVLLASGIWAYQNRAKRGYRY